MTLISLKKVRREILEKTINSKQLIVYLFLACGSVLNFIRPTRFEVIKEAYKISSNIGILITVVVIVRYYLLYKMLKERNAEEIAYTSIPLIAVTNFTFSIFFTLPMVFISVNILKFFQLEFAYWNVINSAVISLISSIIISIVLLKEMKAIISMKNNERG